MPARIFLLAASAALLAALLSTGEANAAPVQYLLSGSGSGSLGGEAFTDAGFTITFSADTDSVFLESVDNYYNSTPTLPLVIAVSGLGEAVITEAMSVNSLAARGKVGLLRSSGFDFFNVESSLLAGYDLTTSTGPIASSSGIGSSQGSISTDRGALRFDQYGAARAWSAAVVPEPGTALLLGLGLALMSRRMGFRSLPRESPRESGTEP